MGEGFDIAAGNRPEEDQFKQFIFWHSGGPASHEARAQALLVVRDIARLFAHHWHRGDGFVHQEGERLFIK